MVLLEQFGSISSAIDILIPIAVFGGILWDMRVRVFKKAVRKAEDVEKRVFDYYDKSSIVNKIDIIDKKLDDALIDIAELGGHKHDRERRYGR